MRLVCVIPARFAASRLPGKPLRLLQGEPLIVRVARRALGFGFDGPVVVASDDPRVLVAVAGLDVTGVLTAGGLASGTERAAAVLEHPACAGADTVLNLQGDEPFLPRAAAAGALERVRLGDDVGTAAGPLTPAARRDPNRVKVEVDGHGRARRFYRAFDGPTCPRPLATFQHVGVYAFRAEALRRWATLPPTEAEERERLEQLRPLHYGMTIGVAVLPDAVPHGIDTEHDLRTAEALL